MAPRSARAASGPISSRDAPYNGTTFLGAMHRMKVSSQQITVRQLFNGRSPLATLKDATDLAFGSDVTPLRVAVTSKTRAGHQCEIEAVEPKICGSDDAEACIFDYRQRRLARTDAFN